MALPLPDPFGFPDSPEQAISDFLLHTAIGAGALGAAYVYTGLYAGPGTAGTMWLAFLSRAPLGASGVVAFEETMFALSVYAEPFVAAAGIVAPAVGVSAAVAIDALYSDAVIHSESLTNVQKSIALGTSTNVPYF